MRTILNASVLASTAAAPAFALAAAAVMLAACSTSASTWQRPGTSEDATKADMAACQSASADKGYGSWGASYRNFVIRCMQDKGYQAGN